MYSSKKAGEDGIFVSSKCSLVTRTTQLWNVWLFCESEPELQIGQRLKKINFEDLVRKTGMHAKVSEIVKA